jgi:uncharacterized MAPEG superfamily protein
MSQDLLFVAYAAVLTWVMLMTASFLRNRMWTPKGTRLALGNRDAAVESSVIAGRADRAAKNMLENFVLFAAVVLAAHVGGVPSSRVAVGAAIFFWARVAYFGVYLAGVPYVRTAVWAVGVAGTAMILWAILCSQT